MTTSSIMKAEQIFRENQGILRTARAMELGIAPITLYTMRDEGLIVREGRGLYRLASLDPLGYPDLVQVSMLVPKAVICLISALDFHGLTTQIPHKIYIALPRPTRKPKIEYPPVEVILLTPKPFLAGIQEYSLDNVGVRIYDKEKSIADSFKFRNKIGLDVALEALKIYLRGPGAQVEQLLSYAKIDRVEPLLIHYLEAIA